MSLEALYASQQAAHDVLVAAGVESGAAVRLPRRSVPHPASLSLGWALDAKGTVRQIARIRFRNVRRNQWRVLTESDLPRLEVKVGARYVLLKDLRADGAAESRRIASELTGLGLRVIGPVDGLAGWRPGAVVAHSVTSPKLAALSDRYSFAAAGLSAAIATRKGGA